MARPPLTWRPLLLFCLRGRGQDELLEGLRRRVGDGSGADAGTGSDAPSAEADDEPVPAADATPLDPASFGSAGEAPPRIDLPSQRPDLSLPRRLGPFTTRDDDLVAHLGPVYRNVASVPEAAFEAAGADMASEDDGATGA